MIFLTMLRKINKKRINVNDILDSFRETQQNDQEYHTVRMILLDYEYIAGYPEYHTVSTVMLGIHHMIIQNTTSLQ